MQQVCGRLGIHAPPCVPRSHDLGFRVRQRNPRRHSLASLRVHMTTLVAAAAKGCSTAVYNMLQATDADPTAYNSGALRVGVRHRHVNVVRVLLSDGRADPAACNSEAVRSAARHRKALMMQALLDDGRADPAACGGEALVTAAQRGNVAVVRLLLADGRAVEAANSALVGAAQRGNVNVVQVLLADRRADPTWNASDALRIAVTWGRGLVVEALLADGRANARAIRAAGPVTGGRIAVVRALCVDGRMDVPASVRADAREWCIILSARRWMRRRAWFRAATACAPN
jgi:hypothetical protein